MYVYEQSLLTVTSVLQYRFNVQEFTGITLYRHINYISSCTQFNVIFLLPIQKTIYIIVELKNKKKIPSVYIDNSTNILISYSSMHITIVCLYGVRLFNF